MNLELEALDSPKFQPNDIRKTYAKPSLSVKKTTDPILLNVATNPVEKKVLPTKPIEKITKQVEELTTKTAVTFLLAGTLASKVCRYCLNVTEELYELGNAMEIARKGALYSVTINQMIACFHPFKVADDPNLPDKICDKCLDRTINSYLFTQQCEQTERALANCFEDIYSKFSKLDPLEGKKYRGRKKTHFNYNTIHVEHLTVIDYADPIIHIVNTSSESLSAEPAINPLECLKCCQVLPNEMSLANHSKMHPPSMWYSCRLCGQSFSKLYLVKRHYRQHEKDHHKPTTDIGKFELNQLKEQIKHVKPLTDAKFECKQCAETHNKYYEHIQHLEMHKFKMVMDHLVHGTMDKLCSICLDKGNLVPLDKMVSIHGGPPDLMGDRTMESILASTLPEMSFLNNYTGSKICEKCINNAITSYNFKSHTYFVRDGLNTCLSHMLDSLKDVTPENNLCIEIAKDIIMPIKEPVDESIFEQSDDEIKKEEFLEDEYRIKSEEDEDSETETKPPLKWHALEMNNKVNNNKHSLNCNELKESYLNGYLNDACSEFLTFIKKPQRKKNKKIFSCPKCNKHFLSDYFVKRHILKHISKNVICNPCGTIFGNQFSLNEHTKYAHVLYQSDYRACKICGRGFPKLDKLKHHEKQHRNKVCPLCDKIFKTQRYFDIHIRKHIPKLMALKKKYGRSCSLCEKECSNENQLSLHVNKVHLQIKPHSCDMCEKQFYTEYNLKFHRKIHSKFRKEKCDFCDKILTSRKKLVIHIRKHIGVTPHACQICNQSYCSLLKLKQHMNSTHGGTFLCKICKHVSVSKSELKIHVGKAHSFL